jgi:hypothetical protein
MIKYPPTSRARDRLRGNGFTDFLYGVDRLPNSVKSLLKSIGDRKIVAMNVVRTPIEPAIEKLVNFVTAGNIESAKRDLHYDNIFHLMIVFKLDNGELYSLEKNEIIQLRRVLYNIYDQRGLEFKYVPVGLTRISLNELMNNTITQYGIDTLIHYSIVAANCQDFITKVLTANKLMTQELNNFINQDVQAIVANIPKPLLYLGDKFVHLVERARYLWGEGMV